MPQYLFIHFHHIRGMKSFSKICSDIKNVKIQGAINVAKSALKAYSINPTKNAKRKLISLRPTEPAMFNALNIAEKKSIQFAEQHFTNAQQFINHYVLKMIPSKSIIATHCHSNTLAEALISAHKSGKNFKVVLTETRPLYQGRKTASQLSRAGINVSYFVDAAMHESIKQADLVMLGADAVTPKGAINKIGSAAIAEIANTHKKPLYIVTDSWKYYSKPLLIEQRPKKEIWSKAPGKINLKNPAFEIVPKKHISKIISELGLNSYSSFLKEAKKELKRAAL